MKKFPLLFQPVNEFSIRLFMLNCGKWNKAEAVLLDKRFVFAVEQVEEKIGEDEEDEFGAQEAKVDRDEEEEEEGEDEEGEEEEEEMGEVDDDDKGGGGGGSGGGGWCWGEEGVDELKKFDAEEQVEEFRWKLEIFLCKLLLTLLLIIWFLFLINLRLFRSLLFVIFKESVIKE